MPLTTASGTTSAALSTTALPVGAQSITATYSGDGFYNTVTTSPPASVGVTRATTATSLGTSGTPAAFGAPVTFTATVTPASGSGPTGTVTFTDGSATLGTSPVSTSAGVTTATFTTSALSAGTHAISATYNGDGNFMSSSTTQALQQVITPPPTTLTTSLSGAGQSGTSITVPAGTSVTDAATLAGVSSANATGSVTYNVYSDSACSTPFGSGQAVAVAGGVVPASSGVTFSTPGTYYWTASYGGDANNQPSSSSCGAETVTVVPTATTLTTTLIGGGQTGTSITVPAGTAVGDAAGLAGANSATATGTVTYSMYSDSACTQLVGSAQTVTVSGGVVPGSAGDVLNVPGTYYWTASYSGDKVNLGSSSSCGAEKVVVAATATTLTTSLTGAGQTGTSITVPAGTSVADAATLSGANSAIATGTVRYSVYSDSACTQPVAAAQTVTVSGGVVPASAGVTLNAPGTYYWTAAYGGDPSNGASSSACGAETVVVTAVTTTTTTTSSTTTTTPTTTTTTTTTTPTTTTTTTPTTTTTTTPTTTTTTTTTTTPTTTTTTTPTTTTTTTPTTTTTTTPTTTTTTTPTTTTTTTPTTTTTTTSSTTSTTKTTTTTSTTKTTTTTTTTAVKPVVTMRSRDTTVLAGATATFTAAASGTPVPAVQWQVSTNGGFTFSNIQGATSTTLTIANVPYSSNGYRYRAVFSNSAGTAVTRAATLTVTLPPGTPTVAAVFPNRASPGSIILIFGSNLRRATAVDFGASPAFFAPFGNGVIIAQVPAVQTNGTVDITVHVGALVSPTSSADRFTFTTGRPTWFGFGASTRAPRPSAHRTVRARLTRAQVRKIRGVYRGKLPLGRIVSLHG